MLHSKTNEIPMLQPNSHRNSPRSPPRHQVTQRRLRPRACGTSPASARFPPWARAPAWWRAPQRPCGRRIEGWSCWLGPEKIDGGCHALSLKKKWQSLGDMEVIIVYPSKKSEHQFSRPYSWKKRKKNTSKTTLGLTCSLSIIQVVWPKAADFPRI